MSQFTFSQAERQGIKPLVGLYGESNSGKTFSALQIARGYAGPKGKIILGDTESGRGALYANSIPGGYLRCDILPPFSPQRFIEFLDAAEAQNPDAIVIDSFSHEHEGEGGVLDMAMENELKSGRPGLSNWKAPKMAHQKLVLRLLRSKTFIIVCLRAKFKTRQIKENGKTAIVKDDYVSPIQDESFIFEMTAHMEMQPRKPGTIRLTKWSVPDLADCFPKEGELLSSKHGEAIRAWAGSAGGTAPTAPAQTASKPAAPAAEVGELKKRLVERLRPHFKLSTDTKSSEFADGMKKVSDYLKENKVLGADEALGTLPVDRLRTVVEAVEETFDAEF